MERLAITFFILGLIGAWGVMGVFASSAIAQTYYADDFSKNTKDNYESAGVATWKIEKGELVTRDSNDAWNVILLKEKLWKGWTDYTYEVKVMPETKKRKVLFIYVVFRYAQPVGLDRLNFFSYLMDSDNVIGLYIDRFLNGVRSRPVPGTMTFAGAWVNEEKVYNMKLALTKTTITGYLNDKKQFDPLKEDNLVDGRIGLGVWGADVRFDDMKVYGPAGLAVDPSGKVAVTWGEIKAEGGGRRTK